MTFEDLEKQLQKFYTKVAKSPSVSQKERVYLQAMRAYQGSSRRGFSIRNFGLKRLASLGALVGLLALFMIPRDTQDTIIAGTVSPEFGPIEIIRNNESFLTQKETPLLVGDFVKVGRNARAKVSMPNKVFSVADDRTHFRITDIDAIYLLKGRMESQVMREGEIATDRGFVKSGPGANFEISVTDTGETRIALEKNEVEVFDLFEGSLALREGETLTLRSDTELSESMTPVVVEWTDEKARLTQSKLIIARSKVLRGVENQLSGERTQALKDLKSAENSFLSIVEVIQTPREKELARRKNLSFLALTDIVPLLEAEIQDQHLLGEVRAIEHLLTLTKRNWNHLAFGKPASQVPAFNKMVLLYHLYSLAPKQYLSSRDLLAEKYAHIFLQDIYTNDLKIDQISALNQQIKQLPDHRYAKIFLEKVANQADPYLKTVLGEKIRNEFGAL